jgi:two-component system sensor histidine kinase YesM
MKPKISISRIFFKNFLFFLLPFIFFLIIIAFTLTIITQRVVLSERAKFNNILIEQIKNNYDIIFDDLNTLNITLGTNPQIRNLLKRLYTNKKVSFQEHKIIDAIEHMINMSASIKPHIQSIYIYIENEDDFFYSTLEGLTSASRFHDSDWLDLCKGDIKDTQWTVLRNMDRYENDRTPIPVLSVFSEIKTYDFSTLNGLIITNIHINFFKDLLDKIRENNKSYVIILNKQNKPILVTRGFDVKNAQIYTQMESLQSSSQKKIQGNTYFITKDESSNLGWKYFILTPIEKLYNVSFSIMKYTYILLLVLLVCSIAITYWLAQKNFRHIRAIYSIIKAAEEDKPLPKKSHRLSSEYAYLVDNIISTFLEQKYLKTRLSEHEYKRKTTELLALQSQINPHFLFNSMETIRWKFMEIIGRPNEGNKMINNLNTILKYSLNGKPSELVPIKDEIKYTKSYLDIQSKRFPGNFQTEWEYDKEVENYKIIKIVLQPFVENAIYHGIWENEHMSVIRIQLSQSEQELSVIITDNGAGIPPSMLHKITSQLTDGEYDPNHIGIVNTHKRICLAFGEEYGITDIKSEPGEGTSVYLKLPVIKGEVNEHSARL